MKTSSIEITEQEYLIKLRKDDFDLSFISQLLKRIQNEQLFFSFRRDVTDEGDDLLARNWEDRGFDRLDEK